MDSPVLSALLAECQSRHPVAIELGLSRVRAVAERMGLLTVKARIITVGGTNGKGSTIATLEALLSAHGYRFASYTSPHLLRFSERIRLQTVPMADSQICEALQAVMAGAGEISLTYFETATLAAAWLFQREPLDFWLMEVGLGGRLDAVNLFEPDVSVITSIDFDHMEFLGNTREAIAREKAGIFRENKPVVVADCDPPLVLSTLATELHCPRFQLGENCYITEGVGEWTLTTPEHVWAHLPSPRVALTNAAAAMIALSQLLPLEPSKIAIALSSVYVVGRVDQRVGPVTHWFDVSHNPHGARYLAASLEKQPIRGKTWGVFSCLARKEAAGILAPLIPHVDAWFTGPLESPDAASVQQLEQAFADRQLPVTMAPSLLMAYQLASRAAAPGDRVVVFGSFASVSTCLAWYDAS